MKDSAPITNEYTYVDHSWFDCLNKCSDEKLQGDYTDVCTWPNQIGRLNGWNIWYLKII